MNAALETTFDRQLDAVYERLKPLRDLEDLVRKDRFFRTWGLSHAIISTGALILLANITLLRRPFASLGFWDLVLATAMVTLVALVWIRYARSLSRTRWALTATLLRTFAQDINELRNEKK
jgi:hypothetical protein